MKILITAVLMMLASGATYAKDVVCDKDPSGISEYKVTFKQQTNKTIAVFAEDAGVPVIDSEDYVCEERESGVLCSNVMARGPVITLTYFVGYPKPVASIVCGKKKIIRIGCR